MKKFVPKRNELLIEARHWVILVAFLSAGLYLFTPLRSPLAAEPKVASRPLGTPAPQSNPSTPTDSGAPIGAGAMAAGVATLAATRRR